MANLSSILLSFRYLRIGVNHLKPLPNVSLNHVRHIETNNVITATASPIAGKKQKISKAMKSYLERAQEHDDFMRIQNTEFQIGKRHLANMMGEDPETFTQDDIDRSIEYLFPSGLYDKKARPMMKAPEKVIPQRKAAEFDETGRPHHSMFYTAKPNFFKLLYNIVEHINNLNAFEDRMIRRQLTPDPSLKIDTSGTVWLPKDTLEDVLVETIADIEYDNFCNAMDRLVTLPYSYRIRDFIDQYRKPLLTQSDKYAIPKLQFDESGKSFITVYECLRKSARADVTLRSPGTGKISINGKDITYFETTQPREQLLFPLVFTNMVGKVDVEANVKGGGFSGQAGAIRWGIAMGLRCFVDQETVAKMRIAGLLQRDYRKRERKKPGQAKARKKYTWKKR